jgi:hypothetical protein
MPSVAKPALCRDGKDSPHQDTVTYWWRKTLCDAGLLDLEAARPSTLFTSGLIDRRSP